MDKDCAKSDADWLRIDVKGVVQGVGFRPTVYRVATAMCLDGTVENTSSGATILMRADRSTACRLIERVESLLPPMATIESIEIRACSPPENMRGFRIAGSSGGEAIDVARISPDVAICRECLRDFAGAPRRRDYPLTNCTHCGPRFSITTAVPYDRRQTTMASFAMCEDCAREYSDPTDRRFHAQPVACNHCGPTYSMRLPDGGVTTDFNGIISHCVEIITAGGIVMVKAMGGYNLLTDATDNDAVERLRILKHRPRKPFVVMAPDIDMAREIAATTLEEEQLLCSWRAPAVICRARNSNGIAPEVAPGCHTIGIMLPYMAFQHRLLERLHGPVVVTSANFPGAPIISSDDEAEAYALRNNLPLVSYNREIANREDDSVVRVVDGVPRLLRRSRGYVPEPVGLPDCAEGVAGMGADITSAWALTTRSGIVQGQYVGSLLSESGENFLKESVDCLSRLMRFRPKIVAVDAHKGYASSRIGRQLAARHGAEVVEVWHHHAHALSVMAEYGLEGDVIAVVLDGAGAGPDGTVWGAELLRCNSSGFTRLDHGPYMPLPGGDKASLQPWRMAVALTWILGRTDLLPERLIKAVGGEKVEVVRRMIERGVNSPLSCGAGRLFDAVAALLGLAYDNGYESEAPVLLENIASRSISSPYHNDSTNPLRLSFLTEMLEDIAAGCPTEIVAARFHDTYADAWSLAALQAAKAHGLNRVVLAGGVMNNARLTGRIASNLRNEGLEVMSPMAVPAGDGGIAVGQIVYACRKI
ncbi:MAG: carbamoyltransferase HypF [Paramuribaculum sp.]|nr:carbamoyltransferase HypF [Paramuribaculum sp.]